MSTFYVRKNGSGTHTTIQSAIYVAVNGDTIDIGEGTFNENVEISSKSITLQGAGKDKTIIQGKATNDTFTGCSYYGGESVVTMPSTSGLIVGKSVSGLAANTRISEIVSSTQFQTSIATATAGNIAKTGVTWSSGSSTITLPSTTAVVVGMKVEGAGVAAFVSAYNATTKVVTLSSPTTQAGSAASLLFRKAYSNITVTQLTNPGNNSFPGSIMVSGITDGLVIKDLRAIGFENSDLGQEAAALFMYTTASPGHNNFLIDNCQITADGDCAFLHGSKPFLTNGTFQNCIIDGNTFTGSEPTDVPSFSTYISPAIISSVGASSSVVTFADMRGVILGRTFSSAGAFTSSATVTAISGNSVTINKVITGTVGSSIDCTFGLTQYGVPNVPRNLFYLGTTSSLYNISNITFKNNLVKGATGAVISATGSKSVFNCVVTINSIGGLIENNVFDGNFGAGSPNEMGVNYVLRSLQPNMVVQNNVNKTSGGRGNSGYLIGELGTSINNTTIDRLLVEVSQFASNTFIESMMEKGALKAISKVSSDAVFSDEANWKLVNFVFKHSSSSKRLVSSFRSTFGSSKKTKLKTSMKVGDRFELQKIIISKSDRSHLVVKRSELSEVSSFDFDLLADGPSGSPSNPSVILAGAYTVGSNPMQNLTSRSPAEGQSFVLSSPTSVTSVKVMISKYSNPSGLPLTGTLNMTLKSSDYSGNGAEVVSSNTLDLSTLAASQSDLDGGVICEFVFDTPVSLPSGTSSIKYNYAGLNVDGSTFIQVWGYSPSIGDGLAYSYGGQVAHVDFWFQILGN